MSKEVRRVETRSTLKSIYCRSITKLHNPSHNSSPLFYLQGAIIIPFSFLCKSLQTHLLTMTHNSISLQIIKTHHSLDEVRSKEVRRDGAWDSYRWSKMNDHWSQGDITLSVYRPLDVGRHEEALQTLTADLKRAPVFRSTGNLRERPG